MAANNGLRASDAEISRMLDDESDPGYALEEHFHDAAFERSSIDINRELLRVLALLGLEMHPDSLWASAIFGALVATENNAVARVARMLGLPADSGSVGAMGEISEGYASEAASVPLTLDELRTEVLDNRIGPPVPA
jgi:hypothetical protein